MVDALVAAVADLSIFAGLSREEHERLAAMAVEERYPAGSTVFQENDDAGDLHVILEGRVTLCMRVPGQPDTCFLSLHEGELLGWSALLNRPRVATARVMRPSRLLRLPRSELLSLCEADHHVGYAIMRQAFEEIAERLHVTRLQLLDMFGSREP